jgi:hypothetical protein
MKRVFEPTAENFDKILAFLFRSSVSYFVISYYTLAVRLGLPIHFSYYRLLFVMLRAQNYLSFLLPFFFFLYCIIALFSSFKS